MKRSKMVPFKLAVSIAAVAALALTAGCGGGGGGGTTVDTVAPVISGGSAVLPSGFSFEGGPVTLYADVTDNVGVSTVTAVVSYSSKSSSVTLSRASGNRYQATWTAPENTGTETLVCQVVVTATDAASNQSAYYRYSVSVPSVDGGPPPPPELPE